jgi:hypothetical protein
VSPLATGRGAQRGKVSKHGGCGAQVVVGCRQGVVLLGRRTIKQFVAVKKMQLFSQLALDILFENQINFTNKHRAHKIRGMLATCSSELFVFRL